MPATPTSTSPRDDRGALGLPVFENSESANAWLDAQHPAWKRAYAARMIRGQRVVVRQMRELLRYIPAGPLPDGWREAFEHLKTAASELSQAALSIERGKDLAP